MTKEKNIATLNEHLTHWKRLLSEKICDQSEGEKTIDALQNAIKALEQEQCADCCNGNQIEKAKLCQKSYLAGMEHKQEPQWIPCSERLPEEDEWVLITFDEGIEIASLDDDGWCYSSVGNDDWIAEHPPVAWMPLPQPYKQEG